MKKNILKRKKIGVLMGGTSAERDVSLRSGEAVFHALKSRKYNAVKIDAGADLCAVLKKKGIEIAFIALHGGHGENGAIQGMLEVLGIPYTGSGVLASALAMDKEASKKAFLYHGITVPAFRVIMRDAGKAGGKHTAGYRGASLPFALPWVVKPVAEGSSIGVEIVKEKRYFKKALDEAFVYGDKVIVEQYIAGKEIQIGILNDRDIGGVEVRPSLEFYNYKAKYTAGLTEYIFPPQVHRAVSRRCSAAALAAHRALGCSGATRVDLRVDKQGKPFVLEVNTIPGMTATSLLPKIALQAGLDFGSLLEKILEGIDAQ